MPRHKPKTIQERGLRAHITDMGYSYTLFQLLVRAKAPDTVIAAVLGVDRDKKPDRRTIRHWKLEYKTEQGRTQATADKSVDSLHNV
jgi:hypothetical protein